MQDPQNKLAKWNVATALLNKGSLFIHLDPRVTGVIVPTWLTHQPQLVLQVGYEMSIPIPDLQVDAEGIAGTLSFSRTPFFCYTPWDAVFALVGDEGHGMVWDESTPPEITAEIERETQKVALRKQTHPVETLRAIKPIFTSAKPRGKEPAKRKLPSYLRVIK